MDNDIAPDRLAEQVRDWLAENWRGVDDREWREKVVLAGWAAPTFPENAYGLGLSKSLAQVVGAEFTAVGAPRACQDLGPGVVDGWVRMIGLVVALHGLPALREQFVRDLLVGDADGGLALYSEPNAGSDLAGLQTRAVLDGDHWIVNGQKVWSSGPLDSTWGALLARTDEDVPKHQGISFFIVDLQQPGVEVRPIKQITGDSEFNEVFLTDVRVPVENVVGEINDGWAILQVALGAEREWLGEYLESIGRTEETAGDHRSALAPIADGAADLVRAARRAGRADDSAIRQTIVQLHTWRLVHEWTTERLSSASDSAQSQVAAAALGKLASSRILHSVGRFKAQMLGPEAMLYGPENRTGDDVNREMMNAFTNSVGGGTDQIQRNIISERLLGMPRAHTPDRGVPFRDIRKGTTQRNISG
ncbi:acyl-CoA dehydrogenase family protein [Trujillonella endophytica]|uniref:Acyl-CoA dehydrogenase n=1 Tax=Trujillonella endophytica TaxID=673521 RepID=A0A1H8QSD0_9ACTN|nr:acyl-CoA dehydrogenase family protein [Trujillella endophytica]SEO56927.1 Acyl-CoA dehydrogenase [Trujillella endophytica]